MYKNKITVSIGIPAYNEESNIGLLIKNILSQKQTTFKLDKIYVVSDLSTDNTDKIVNSFPNKSIKLIRNKQRKGKALSQNVILEISKSDVLIIFDADVLPSGKIFIVNIIKPFLKDKNIGIVGGSTLPIRSNTLVGSVVNFSVNFKKHLYTNIRGGNNIYMCHGRVRAFNKFFYKDFRWNRTVGEDAYSYLACITKGWKFIYANNAVVIYRSPETLTDHFKQSLRFLDSQKEMEKYFNKDIVKTEYKIPFFETFSVYFKSFVLSPIMAFFYLTIYLYTKTTSMWKLNNSPFWDVSFTTKRLK